MLILLDNYDSFTYNLKDYLEQLGAEVLVVRNDEKKLTELIELRISGIVISPGPGKPITSGILMEIISYYHDKVPLLGICLGHQAIGEYFGAKLVKAAVPVHGKTSRITVLNHPMFVNVPKVFKVCRYHSLILKAPLFDPLKTIAKSNDGTIMALCHKTLPIWGMQFHPEAILTEYGLQLLKNWLKLTVPLNPTRSLIAE